MQVFTQILLWPLKALAFLVLLFYEWGWEPLSREVARMVRFRWMAYAERKVKRAPPWLALLLFATPTLVLLPFKLGALWLVAHGQKLLGIVVIVLAKIVGTAFVAWIFKLTQPALMQLRWFAYVYPRVKAWKDRWLAWMRGTAMWRAASAAKLAMRSWVQAVRQWVRR
jgi:hypothetical protein